MHSNSVNIFSVRNALILISLITAGHAMAEGPMVTDDAGTLEVGGMKIEGILSRDSKVRGTEFVLGYGPADNIEIGLAFSRATDLDPNPSSHMRTIGLGVKWVPIKYETGLSLGASFGYGKTRVNEQIISAYMEREYAFSALATYHLKNGQVLHSNIGVTRVRTHNDNDTVGTWGIGYEFPLEENLQLTIETFGETHAGPNKAIGLRYEIVDGLKISGAMGHGNDRSFGQVGFAWEF